MSRGAAVFLVLLRLAIGWHFLFEGIQKVHSRLERFRHTGAHRRASSTS